MKKLIYLKKISNRMFTLKSIRKKLNKINLFKRGVTIKKTPQKKYYQNYQHTSFIDVGKPVWGSEKPKNTNKIYIPNILYLLLYLFVGWLYYIMLTRHHSPFADVCIGIGVIILAIDIISTIVTLVNGNKPVGGIVCIMSFLISAMSFSTSAWLILPIPVLLGLFIIYKVWKEYEKSEGNIKNKLSSPSYVEEVEDSRGNAVGFAVICCLVIAFTIIGTILLIISFFINREWFI